MGNTVVTGGAPATQIAGSLSDGVSFQNLSASKPAYIGYDPSVTSSAFSGYLAPGGSYTTPKGKNVWIYSDADCPIVYDYGTGASPGSGSQVSVSGTVGITGKPAVAVPDNVNVNNLNTWTTIGSWKNQSTTSNFVAQLASVDVSKYNTLAVGFYNSAPTFDTRDATMLFCQLAWQDNDGNIIDIEGVSWQWFAQGQLILPNRGSRVTVVFTIDRTNFGAGVITMPSLFVSGSLDTIPERYVNDPYGYCAGTVLFSSGTVPPNAGNTMELSHNTDIWDQKHVTNAFRLIHSMPSIAGKVEGNWNVDNTPSGVSYYFSLGAMQRGQIPLYHNIFVNFVGAGGGGGTRLSKDISFIVPRAPLVYDVNSTGTTDTYPTLSLAYNGKQ